MDEEINIDNLQTELDKFTNNINQLKIKTQVKTDKKTKVRRNTSGKINNQFSNPV